VNIGAKDCRLDHCTIAGNSGRGLYFGTANHCLISSNTALSSSVNGGGAYQVTLTDCFLYGNRATNGGGAYECVLNGCVLSNNTALAQAAAPGRQPTLRERQCVVGNSAGVNGGGFYSSVNIVQRLTNWTFVAIPRRQRGGSMRLFWPRELTTAPSPAILRRERRRTVCERPDHQRLLHSLSHTIRRR